VGTNALGNVEMVCVWFLMAQIFTVNDILEKSVSCVFSTVFILGIAVLVQGIVE